VRVGNSSPTLVFPVDTLYFDTLQFLYHLALGVLVGGAIVLGGPARRYDQVAGSALFVLALTSVLKLFAFEDTDIGPRLVARWIALIVLAVATLYASDFDDLPDTSPARREYAQLGRSAARAMRVVVASGLVALFLS